MNNYGDVFKQCCKIIVKKKKGKKKEEFDTLEELSASVS
jgi:hypothetical protein